MAVKRTIISHKISSKLSQHNCRIKKLTITKKHENKNMALAGNPF